jgi:hypothetical protein
MHADFEWFIRNQDRLVKKYNGKVLAIRNKRVLGAFASAAAAINGVKYEMGEFLVQRCVPGEKAYSAVVHTPGMVLL